MESKHGHSVVGSVYGAALYVTHYICKDESQVLKHAIAQKLANLQQDATARQSLRKIENTLPSHRARSCISCGGVTFERIITHNSVCLSCAKTSTYQAGKTILSTV